MCGQSIETIQDEALLLVRRNKCLRSTVFPANYSIAAPLVAGFIACQISDLKPEEVATLDIKELLWQKFSRITDTYSIKSAKDGKVYPIRCLTAFVQESQGKKGEKDLPCKPLPRPVGPADPQGEGMLKVVTTVSLRH